MTTPVTEFIVLTLKNRAAWPDVTDTLKAVPGVNAVYAGAQLEDPSKTVLVAEWASPDAFSAFAASEAYMPWFASLKAVAAPPPLVYKVPFAPGSDPAAALGAPCTEVFVAYGVDDGFLDRTAAFAGSMAAAAAAAAGAAPVPGFHGHAYGAISTPLAVEGESGDGDKGPAVTLLLGWDSKEAHLDAKAKPGPISDNIHLLRSGRKSISMYHVNLKRI